MYPSIKLLTWIIFSFSLLACYSEPGFRESNFQQKILSKIRFDLTIISPEGLIGSSDSLRSLDYEFCIPTHPTYRSEIRQIDPTIQIYRHSRGRINCSPDRYLCIGNTHRSNWHQILTRLARLPYIEKIEQSFAE